MPARSSRMFVVKPRDDRYHISVLVLHCVHFLRGPQQLCRPHPQSYDQASRADHAMRRLLLSIIVIGAIAIGVWYVYTRGGGEHIFITAPVERGAIATIVKATGSVEAVITVDVSSQLSGQFRKCWSISMIR
jgi:hypothetical protein